jgi:hypothetical protein
MRLPWEPKVQASADPLDEVMLKPVTRRQIENRRLYIRDYMRKRRAAERSAYFASRSNA